MGFVLAESESHSNRKKRRIHTVYSDGMVKGDKAIETNLDPDEIGDAVIEALEGP
jgi:hypothetical protein